MFFVYTDALIIYTFSLHIYTFSSLKQSGDTERALRNVNLWKNHFRHAFGFVMHMLLVKRHFESSVVDWGFVDIWFVLVSTHVKMKKRRGNRLHYSYNQEICIFLKSSFMVKFYMLLC